MAPPPNASLPLQERLLALAKTLQCTFLFVVALDRARAVYGLLTSFLRAQLPGLLGASPALLPCLALSTRLPSDASDASDASGGCFRSSLKLQGRRAASQCRREACLRRVARIHADWLPDNRHLTLILATLRYGFSWLRMNYYGSMAQFSYRTSFVAAAVTYGIVVYKTQRARAKTNTKMPGGVIGLLSDENVQYLRMS
jgi:hypothetical protein